VFSTTYCGYCTKAKKLLKQQEVPYQEIMIDELVAQDAEALSDCLYAKSERRTVPIIYMHNKRVGGYGELLQMQKNDTLKPL
jgi:glutaredoxin 3